MWRPTILLVLFPILYVLGCSAEEEQITKEGDQIVDADQIADGDPIAGCTISTANQTPTGFFFNAYDVFPDGTEVVAHNLEGGCAFELSSSEATRTFSCKELSQSGLVEGESYVFGSCPTAMGGLEPGGVIVLRDSQGTLVLVSGRGSLETSTCIPEELTLEKIEGCTPMSDDCGLRTNYGINFKSGDDALLLYPNEVGELSIVAAVYDVTNFRSATIEVDGSLCLDAATDVTNWVVMRRQ